MVEAPPFEEDAAARQLELLDDSDHHDAVLPAAVLPQVGFGMVPGRDERRIAVGEKELVQVRAPAVSGLEPLHHSVARIEDHVRPLAEPVLGLPLPPRQHRLAEIRRRPEVQRRDGLRRVEVDDVAVVVDQHRAARSRSGRAARGTTTRPRLPPPPSGAPRRPEAAGRAARRMRGRHSGRPPPHRRGDRAPDGRPPSGPRLSRPPGGEARRVRSAHPLMPARTCPRTGWTMADGS